MSAGTILLVEHNPLTRNMLRATLEIEGYEVVDSPDGKTALELAAARRPDLLILDNVLPDMDGLELLAEVRVKAGEPEVPAIVITGMVSRLSELRARSGASTHVLGKPVDPSQLIEVVHAQLDPAVGRTGGQRILVVDDEPRNLKLAASWLKRAGYEVETASGGKEALEIARHHLPDAILSDVLMPSMDGFSFCHEARRDPALARVPIILVSSAYVDEADGQLAHQMGANALVVRTPDLGDALNAIEAGLRGTVAAPLPATSDDVTALRQERLFVQLERQTARNQALLRQAAIQATALSIMGGVAEVLAQPRDVPGILGDVLVHCLDAGGLSTGLLYVAEPTGEHRLQAQFGIPVDRRADAEALFGHPQLMRRIVESGQPVALSSAAEDVESRDFLARLGYSSVLVLPFVVFGETFGELVLASENHDLSESSWIGFARSLAVQFGQTVALGQALKRLGASESRYRALMEHAHDAILILDPTSKVLEVNRETERLLGRPREEIVGRRYHELVAPEEQADSERLHEQLLADGTLRVQSRQMARADGAQVWVEVSASLASVGDESVVLMILRDITDRRRAQQDLHQRMELAAFAGDVGAALVGNQPLPTVLQQCAEAMMRHLHPALARIWTIDAAGDTLELQASAGMYTDLDGAHARVPVGQLEIGLIAKERQPLLSNDVLHDPRLGGQAWAAREGMVAFAGYPLVVGEHLVGVLAMFARHPLSPTVLEAMTPVASHIALGIERKQSEEALRKAQQRLQHVVSSSPAVLYSLRVEGSTRTPTWVSGNVERNTGYTAAEISSPEWWEERLHPDDREKVMAQVPALPQDSLVREYRFRHKDGTYRWVRDEQIRVAHPGQPDEIIGSWSDITERKEAELKLHESEEQYRLLFDHNPYPMWVYDLETLVFLAVNDAAVRHYGWTQEEFLRMRLGDIRPPETVPALMTRVAALRGEPGPHDVPSVWRHRKKDGGEIDVETMARSITFKGRAARLKLAADVTEKTVLQAQLVRAQKMEAVGQLAGGVAHDFNNLLGVITGYSELLMRELPAESRGRKRVEEIRRASDRAGALTRQLLAFSRRQVLQPKVLDLNEVVSEVEKMLLRLISAEIQIVTVAAPGLGKVRADAGQIEQVLMNLAINARDAMPSGGRLVIETGNVELDATYVRTNPDAHPGPHVMLAVTDTGHGMDADTMSRIFEPFFTTKEEGKGTGLGLATAYGIVRQSGGSVNVYSEPGQGSTFRVYLPRVEAEPRAEPRATLAASPGGRETILVVEDAEALRLLVRELLESAGYTVLDAEAPDTALSVVQATPGPIHLVLTDMVMPRMNGQELARQIATLKPEARMVFMSGYSDQAMGDQGTLEPGTPFLQKPFTMDALMRTVRGALDAGLPTREPSGS